MYQQRLGPPPKYPESFRLPQSLQELRDKLAFNEGKSSFPGKNAAAGESVSMVLAPPFKDTSPETKVVNNGKCRYLESSGKSRVKSLLFIKILFHSPRDKGGLGIRGQPTQLYPCSLNKKTKNDALGPPRASPPLARCSSFGKTGHIFQCGHIQQPGKSKATESPPSERKQLVVNKNLWCLADTLPQIESHDQEEGLPRTLYVFLSYGFHQKPACSQPHSKTYPDCWEAEQRRKPELSDLRSISSFFFLI